MAGPSLPYTLLLLSYMLWATAAMGALKQPRPALLERAAAPPPPSKDPFYTAPRGYEHAAPGAVLRVRSAPGLAKVIANCSAAYNLLYRTTDSNYKPTWAVTTLYVPETNATSFGGKGAALLSHQVACQ
jgi:hypothetical protein